MVRQAEVAKTRRSNMANSSVNTPPKKGGAGGSFTWGAAEDVADYELVGFDAKTIGISAAPAQIDAPADTNALVCNLSLDDKEEFPALVAKTMTPEKVSKPAAEAPSEVETTAEVEKDWIMLPVADVSKKNGNVKSADAYDGQHPRNMFNKKAQVKRAKSTERHQVSERGVDWSGEGMPTEVKRQIIHASMTASHRGLYAKDQAAPVPINMLRTQNRSSSTKRQNSGCKTPRSQSAPRPIQQPVGRR